jgi:hypothetical protein
VAFDGNAFSALRVQEDIPVDSRETFGIITQEIVVDRRPKILGTGALSNLLRLSLGVCKKPAVPAIVFLVSLGDLSAKMPERRAIHGLIESFRFYFVCLALFPEILHLHLV